MTRERALTALAVGLVIAAAVTLGAVFALLVGAAA